jgi:hypothetical protein
MNKTFASILLIVAVLIAGYFIYMNKADGPMYTPDLSKITNFDECVKATGVVLESYPAQCKTPDGRTFVQNIGNELEKMDKIQAANPRPNQSISSPLTITGKARGPWYFEASFPAKLYDANGKQIGVVPVTAQGEWMTTEFVPFKATMTFSQPQTATGTLVLERDNASGLPENDDSLIIPVVFSSYAPGGIDTAQNKMNVKAFFGNSSTGAECEKVASVNRQVTKAPQVGAASILELLKGPTATEKAAGFTTAINAGTHLNNINIKDGVATVDFSSELGKNVAGSCRVAAIRAQITETLKQFATVKSVIISINGKSKDILQP